VKLADPHSHSPSWAAADEGFCEPQGGARRVPASKDCRQQMLVEKSRSCQVFSSALSNH
jgi:hypothetical protein